MNPAALDPATLALVAALARLEPAARQARLVELRLSDPGLAQQLGEYLALADEQTLADTVALSSTPALLPSRIGPFTVLGLLGEGGMGTVYLARQDEPPREVALKVIRGLGGSAEALRRFAREAQTLARLEHPGIARIYASGSVEGPAGSLPWLAMEYVRGRDLATHAAALDLPGRIRLLIELARAVHHAHGRGVIHRDLKPANVLVDAGGRPRILDFGVARLQDEAGGMTMIGQVLGTVAYMSPEQLSGDARGAGVASDVYALGVIAYEILSGTLPHPSLSGASLLEALELVRTRPPEPLGRRDARLRGDIETVVMKALAADPAQRYASADALAADFVRILERRPIEARPPTWSYLALRFAQRNRIAVAATTVVVLALLAASLISLRFALSEADARALAERRAAEAEAVSAFLTDMLSRARPEQALGRELSLRELLLEAAATADAPGGDPRVDAVVQRTLSGTFRSLGLYREAVLRQQLALERLPQDSDPAERWLWQRELLAALIDAADFAEAAALLAELDQPDLEPERQAMLLISRARLADDQGQREAAIPVYRELLALVGPGGLDESDELVQTARLNLSSLLRDRGEYAEAERLLLALLARRESALGRRHPRTLSVLHNLAALRVDQGQLEQGEALYAEVLQARREVLGPRHGQTLATLQGYGSLLLSSGRLEPALPMLAEAAAAMEDIFGLVSPDSQVTLGNYAYALEASGRIDEARAAYLRLKAAQVEAGQQDSVPYLTLLNNLGMLELAAGDPQAAEAWLREACERAEMVLGREHFHWMVYAGNYGEALLDLGRHDEARPWLSASAAALKRVLPEGHARLQRAEQRLLRLQGGGR